MLYDLEKRKKRESFNEGFWDNFTNRDVFEDYLYHGRRSTPAVNVVENESEFILELASPGMCRDDYAIKVENDILTISGEKDMSGQEERVYSRREFYTPIFEQSFLLPDYVDKDQIAASCADGILTLHIPKQEVRTKSKRIEIT